MDSTINKEFHRCELEGLCRSDVAGLRMKWIEGPNRMIAQYHPTWQIVKRKSFYTKPNIKEPFSHEAFNFTKIRDSEILAKYYIDNNKVIFIDSETVVPEDVSVVFTILLNVSPICDNHHLIIPNLQQCYSQVWRDEITADLISICQNSERDDFVLFFNSLGGFASVNHLHFQVMYTSTFYATATGSPNPPFEASAPFDCNRLPVERANAVAVTKKEGIQISRMDDWLSQTIQLRVLDETPIDKKTIQSLADYTNTLISMCYEHEYPYDVIMTNHGKEVYVFIRKYQQTIDELRVNPACVELTGIVVYRSEETFDNALESTMMEKCKEVVHFEKEEWNNFVEGFVLCIQNKQ